jgi:hypothetical protein
MNKRIKVVGVLLGGAAMLALAAGTMAFRFTNRANASTATSGMYADTGTMNFRGGPGFFGNQSDYETALANALGISVTDLRAAEQKASDAAIQQMVSQGLITQDQADAMILRGFGIPFGHGFIGKGMFGQVNGIDYNALLANALGISTDQLTSAQQQAEATLLDQAVAAGRLTQAQADLIKAQNALQSYLDPNVLFAQALGISTDQLQADRSQGMSLSQILAQAGKTALEVRDAEQAAYQAAVQKAVSDGVITQAQADQVLAQGYRGLGGFEFGGPGFGFPGGHGRGGFRDGRWPGGPKYSPNPTPTSPAPGGGI